MQYLNESVELNNKSQIPKNFSMNELSTKETELKKKLLEESPDFDFLKLRGMINNNLIKYFYLFIYISIIILVISFSGILINININSNTEVLKKDFDIVYQWINNKEVK